MSSTFSLEYLVNWKPIARLVRRGAMVCMGWPCGSSPRTECIFSTTRVLIISTLLSGCPFSLQVRSRTKINEPEQRSLSLLLAKLPFNYAGP